MTRTNEASSVRPRSAPIESSSCLCSRFRCPGDPEQSSIPGEIWKYDEGWKIRRNRSGPLSPAGRLDQSATRLVATCMLTSHRADADGGPKPGVGGHACGNPVETGPAPASAYPE